MEDSISLISCLNQLEFEEWVNIPKPLVQALIMFKQCIFDQTRKIEEQCSNFEILNSKVSLKLRNMSELLANTNDTIVNQQERIMKKVRESCEFVSNHFNLFKKKFIEENSSHRKVSNESLSEMKEQVVRFGKIISGTLSGEEVNRIINDRSFNLQQTISNDVRDHQVRPIVDRLMNEIKLSAE